MCMKAVFTHKGVHLTVEHVGVSVYTSTFKLNVLNF